jgi:hypothetical protein
VWGDPAPVFESGPEPPAYESRWEPPGDERQIQSPDGSAGPDRYEFPHETAHGDPDGSPDPVSDGNVSLDGHDPPELSGYENPGSTGDLTVHEITGQSPISTRQSLSPNGSRAAGNGQVPARAWPVGVGHAAVTKRREHRILRGLRSGVVLAIIALALGAAAAASLGVIVWLIATAIHHAASN